MLSLILIINCFLAPCFKHMNEVSVPLHVSYLRQCLLFRQLADIKAVTEAPCSFVHIFGRSAKALHFVKDKLVTITPSRYFTGDSLYHSIPLVLHLRNLLTPLTVCIHVVGTRKDSKNRSDQYVEPLYQEHTNYYND